MLLKAPFVCLFFSCQSHRKVPDVHRRLVSTAGNASALVTMFQSVTDVSATSHTLVTCVKTGKVSIKI